MMNVNDSQSLHSEPLCHGSSRASPSRSSTAKSVAMARARLSWGQWPSAKRYRPGFAQAPSFSDPTPGPFPSNLLCCTIPGDGMETIFCFSEINKIKSWKLKGASNNMIDFKGWGGHWTLLSLLFLFPVFQTWNIYSCVQVPVNSAHSRTWLTEPRTQLLLCLTQT